MSVQSPTTHAPNTSRLHNTPRLLHNTPTLDSPTLESSPPHRPPPSHAVGDYFHNDHGTGFRNVLADDAKALLNAIGRPEEVLAQVDETSAANEGGMLTFEDFV